MEKTLRLVGCSSGEIYIMRYPSSLQGFCDFDFSYFAKDAVDYCNESLKTGTGDPERFADLRREIESSHCFIGHHIRTIYDKIVLDCWIDYLCRRDSVGTNTLWNRFIGCNTPFEKQVFSRLCEYRYNRAINEWLNIVRVQDYARCKTDFIFTKNIGSAEDAAARRDYFDLMFSVTAKELGCRLEDLGVTKVFSVGRLPSSPFMFPNVSKEIVRHVLADFDYSDDYSDIEDYSHSSDQIAMDAFARMKAGLPADPAGYNVIRTKMENYPEKIFMPCSLKAAIDLEIDTIIGEGGWLARCKRCGRFFLRDSEHKEEYCRQITRSGKTCLELYEEEHPKPGLSEELLEKCKNVTDKVYARVGDSVSLHEYESWYAYLQAMKGKVSAGEITAAELDDFLNYSLSVDISKSRPIESVEKPRPTKERVVKPFMPERIYRSEIQKPVSEPENDEEEQHSGKDGFFTSPTVQRQKNKRTRISHIIRGGEPRNIGEYSETQPERRIPVHGNEQPADFTISKPETPAAEVKVFESPAFEPFYHEAPGKFVPEFPTEDRNSDTNAVKAASSETIEKSVNSNKISGENLSDSINSVEEAPVVRPRIIKKNAAAISAYGKIAGTPFTAFQGEQSTVSDELSELRSRTDNPPVIPGGSEIIRNEEPDMPYREAISVQPKQQEGSSAAAEPDKEPFRDIGSIFDVLEQSENSMKSSAADIRSEEEPDPEWKTTSEKRRQLPKEVTKENAPKGIWTEGRGLFPKDSAENDKTEQSELDMLKERKHGKSNKTRRLYDVIMREPDDNPNFRK